MPRVLLLLEYPTLNGGERSILSMLDGIRDAGFDVVAACPPKGPLADALSRRNVTVFGLTFFDEHERRLPQHVLREALDRQLRAIRPQLVHANSLSMSRLAGPVSAAVGMPSIGHLRDILRLSAKGIADLNCNSRLVAVSGATRDWHAAAGLDADKTYVMYNGVDLEEFRPRPATGFLHQELGLPRNVELVGCIGQIGIRKGLHIALDALNQVVQANHDVHLIVVGERHSQKDEARHYENDLRQLSAATPLAGRIHFLGRRDDVERILNEMTLLVHAARQEPLGRVLLEAAASGTPIVATDVGGTREILPADEYPIPLVPPNDSTTLADAITRILGNPELRTQTATAGRRRAEQLFDACRASTSLAHHYFETIAATPRALKTATG